MKESKSDILTLCIAATILILSILWMKNHVAENTYDKSMYIVRKECSAISNKDIVELYAGEYVELVLKKTSQGYKIRIMENNSECYIQDISLLRKATKKDSIAYNNHKNFINAIRKAIKEEK